MIQRQPLSPRVASAAFAANRDRAIAGRESSLDGKWIALSADGQTIADCDGDLTTLLSRLQSTARGAAGHIIEHFYLEDAASVGGAELQ